MVERLVTSSVRRRFLAAAGFLKEEQAGHFVAAADGLTTLMVRAGPYPSLEADLPIVHSSLSGLHREGCHPQEGEAGAAFPSPSHTPTISPETYSWALLQTKAQRRRGTFTGQCRQPFCLGDTTKHPEQATESTRTPPGEKGKAPQCFSRRQCMAPCRG